MVLNESQAEHKIQREVLLVGFQLCLGARLPDHHALPHLLRVGDELVVPDWHRNAGRVVRHLVHSVDEVASFLKLNRQEKRGRHVDAPNLDALRVGAAGSYLIIPEVEAGRIRLAVEEVEIVLPAEETWDVARGPAAGRIAVGNRKGHSRRGAKRDSASRRLTQTDRKALAVFRIKIINQKNRDGLRSFARGKVQGPD